MHEPARQRPQESARDPEWSKARLLEAGRAAFSEKGLNGARVDEIAGRAGVNKQLLYYYFKDKEGLYEAVLEHAYGEIREREQSLDLASLAPRAAMERFVAFTFDYLTENRAFVALLNDENVHRARHVRRSADTRRLHDRLHDTIGGILARGEAEGAFRAGIDPVELYISIASLCYFYYSNIHTLSAIFGRDLGAPEAIARRRAHLMAFVMAYLDAGHAPSP